MIRSGSALDEIGSDGVCVMRSVKRFVSLCVVRVRLFGLMWLSLSVEVSSNRPKSHSVCETNKEEIVGFG